MTSLPIDRPSPFERVSPLPSLHDRLKESPLPCLPVSLPKIPSPVALAPLPAPDSVPNAASQALNDHPITTPLPSPFFPLPSFQTQTPPPSPSPPPPPVFQEKPDPAPPTQQSLPGFEEIEDTATDAALTDALRPLVENALENALYAPKTGLHVYLEPMLRATVRRAIAEQMQTMQHFGQIHFWDRFLWKFKALFTSQSYDEIVFERTHRYRVEEVFLLRHDTNSLISYASHDPSRHASSRKIRYDLSRIIEDLKNEDGEIQKALDLPNGTIALIRQSQNCFLIACVRGPINALVRADLDYALSQIEQRFGSRLRDPNQQFLHVLQPLLEGCLLIQSPPAPH